MSGDDAAPVGIVGRMARYIARLPFTAIFLLTIIGANLAAGTFGGDLPAQALSRWGISHYKLLEGELYRLVTATFLSHDSAMLCRQMVFALVVIGYYEWTQGTLRAVGMFIFIDILGSLIVLFAILAPLDAASWAGLDGILFAHDVGMSAGGFGLTGAIIATFKHKSLFLFAILASIAIKVWLQFDPIADTAHVVTLLMGFSLQCILFERPMKPRT